ncbi:MAG: SUF system NifU family Fe-S cluster assembly protein [Rickettsiales bacterium]|nr:SUF system NifU family Fe-S cluster assembly protein [Rickettsiales bacterium]|tara:strand:- start:26 stop:475 length:450 start_codon:yes stop_codon:yes gene_type:complete
MSRLRQLYEQMILDHNKNPRNFKHVEPCTHYSHGHNPLCGDDYKVMIIVKNDIIEDIGFIGDGCAISKASGSMMTEKLIGLPIDDVKVIKNQFLELITSNEEFTADIGKLKVFEGIKQYPVRVKCAALTWRALEDALENTTKENKITTE